MAVHSHSYRPYRGERTPLASRWMVVARYALADALALKKTIALLVLAAFPVLGGAVWIYLHHNAEALKIFELPVDKLLPVDNRYFYWMLYTQAWFAFLITAAAGPRILVADLRDNALPLYLSRPLTRSEYVLGKVAAIAALASLVTWVPSLVLFLLQATLEDGWLLANWWIAPAIVLVACAAIALFSLVCLAIASVLKRKAAAEVAFVASFFVVPIIARVVGEVLKVGWWNRFFLPAVFESISIPLFRLQQGNGLSTGAALLSLAVGIALSLLVLSRRIRAWEVVR